MPRLYLPSTATPLVTPIPTGTWNIVGFNTSDSGTFTQHGNTETGDVLVYLAATDGTPSPDGPDNDGSWTQIVRHNTVSNEWGIAYTRLHAGAASYARPAGMGTVAQLVVTFRHTDPPGPSIGVAGVDVAPDTATTPATVASEDPAVALNLALWLAHGSCTGAGGAWTGTPTPAHVGLHHRSTWGQVALGWWSTQPAGNLPAATYQRTADTAGNQAAAAATIGYTA